MTPEQLAIVVAIVTASISFLAAVVAVVVGQLLGQRFQREADERRFAQKERARRRVRGEEHARQARRALLDAAALYSEEAGAARARVQGSGRWDMPPSEQIEPLTGKAIDLVVEIPAPTVQAFIRQAAAVLDSADVANQGGAPQPWVLARAVTAEADSVIGAYLNGMRLPPWPEVAAGYQAIGAWWAETTLAEEEYREREREQTSARAHRGGRKLRSGKGD